MKKVISQMEMEIVKAIVKLSKKQSRIISEMRNGMKLYMMHGINSCVATSKNYVNISLPTLDKLIENGHVVKASSDWRSTNYELTEFGKTCALIINSQK